MTRQEWRELARELAFDATVAVVGVVALVVNGAYRKWWVSALVAGFLWLQVWLAVSHRRVRRALAELRSLQASEGAGSSESRPPARAPE